MMTRLFRSTFDKKISGVCGGIGDMIGVDPTIVRVVIVVLALVTGVIPFVAGYLLAWWIIPERSAV